jgi:hypothetical protein
MAWKQVMCQLAAVLDGIDATRGDVRISGRISFFVAQVSKPAVPQTSKSAFRQQVWKPAARQVWKPALQAAALVLFARLPQSEMRPPPSS